MSLLSEFKAFAVKGNVVDMAVGIIIGAAFGKIVSSFVGDVVMPPVGMLVGGVDFSDLAITLNDWCSGDDGQLDEARARALLGAYVALRPFTAAEAELWPTLLRVACVRFWLSRLIAAEAFAGQDVLIHDPAEFQRRLAHRQVVELPLPFAL